MNANRIGGASSPEPNKGTEPKAAGQQRRVEKVEKVKNVDEVENERTRKKFQSYMDDDETSQPPSKAPSPYETTFYGSSDDSAAPVPSPSYSPSPNVNEALPSPVSSDEVTPLPRSSDFWSHVDSPPDQPLPPTQFAQTQPPSSRDNASSEEKESGAHAERRGAKVVLPLTAKSRKADQKPEEEISPSNEKVVYGPRGKYREDLPKETSEKNRPTPPFYRESDEKKDAVSLPREEKYPIERRTQASPFKEEDQREELSLGSTGAHFPPVADNEPRQKSPQKPFPSESQNERRKKIGEPRPIESPGIPPVPTQFAPAAQEATLQATSYLNPQIVPLFFQMVGAIYVLVSPGGSGISRTEIQLTAPSFSQSKFFGSTITIEKYATAPDSLNIRLTGNNEAVTLFSQNVQSLYTAFQQGNFNFRIGRIDVSYSREKPLFKRKGKSADSDDIGGSLEDRRDT